MKKGVKIWLWIALVMCVCTTVLNATQSRWPTVGIAVVAVVGLCLLLFKQKRMGFYILCCSNALSFVVGVYGGIQGGTSVLLSVLMSLIGSALVPVITFLFIHSQWKELQ